MDVLELQGPQGRVLLLRVVGDVVVLEWDEEVVQLLLEGVPQ